MSAFFVPGLDIHGDHSRMDFIYGRDVFGPTAERRSLDSIRGSLRQPDCSGPGTVYSIAMDVGKTEHIDTLKRRMLLFGLVIFDSGRLEEEPLCGYNGCVQNANGTQHPYSADFRQFNHLTELTALISL